VKAHSRHVTLRLKRVSNLYLTHENELFFRVTHVTIQIILRPY
jgi:hypothetical protein